MGEVEAKHRPGPGKWPAWLLLCPRRVALGPGQSIYHVDELKRSSDGSLSESWTAYPVDAEAHPPGWNALRGLQGHGY